MADITLIQRVAYYEAIARRYMDMHDLTRPDGNTVLEVMQLAEAEGNQLDADAAAEAIRLLIEEAIVVI